MPKALYEPSDFQIESSSCQIESGWQQELQLPLDMPTTIEDEHEVLGAPLQDQQDKASRISSGT